MLSSVAVRYIASQGIIEKYKVLLGLIFGCSGIVVGIGFLCRNYTLLERKSKEK